MRRFLLIFSGCILTFHVPARAQNSYWRHRLSASILSDNNAFTSGLVSENASIGRLQIVTEHGSGTRQWHYRLMYEGALDYTLSSGAGARHVHQIRGRAAWLSHAGFSAGVHGLVRTRSGFNAIGGYGLWAITPQLSITPAPGWNLSLSGAFHQFDYKTDLNFDYNEQHVQADVRRSFSSAFYARLTGKAGRIDYLSDRNNDTFTQIMLHAEYCGRLLVQAEAGFFKLISNDPGHEHIMPIFTIIAAGNLAFGLTGRLYWASRIKRFNDALDPDLGVNPETGFEQIDFFIVDAAYDISRCQDIWIRWGAYQHAFAERNVTFRKTVISLGTTRRFN